MTIYVATRDPALEDQVRRVLDELGWPCASGAAPDVALASAWICDASGARLGSRDPALPMILLLPDGAPRSLASGPALAARVVVRTPLTRRALENAVRIALPVRAPRVEQPIALDPATRALCAQLEAIAASSLTVVLAGETGTGKTHLARWLHARGGCALGPLVEVAPGALGKAALAEEASDEPGPFERSHGGSLLVEEVGDLPRAEQFALLRFLVERTSERGAPLDVRVIATTRDGLARDAAAGRLHPDLAARLAAVELTLPPLRQRPLEIEAFARRFAERAARRADAEPIALDGRALAALRALPLAGNLHELESLVQRATLSGPEEAVDFASLARTGGLARGEPPAPRLSGETLDLRTLERRAIERALALSRGDRRAAARALGIHPRTLRNKLRADAR
jgi:DNA-binding NtrC family response regulator